MVRKFRVKVDLKLTKDYVIEVEPEKDENVDETVDTIIAQVIQNINNYRVEHIGDWLTVEEIKE